MRVGKQTEKLIRETAILGFAQGAWYAGYEPAPGEYPSDSDVVHMVMHNAKHNTSDLYPTLAKVRSAYFDELERRYAQARNDFFLEIMNLDMKKLNGHG